VGHGPAQCTSPGRSRVYGGAGFKTGPFSPQVSRPGDELTVYVEGPGRDHGNAWRR
jgi:hypothetical protein